MEASAWATLRKSWPTIVVAAAVATLLLALLHDTYLARLGVPSKGLEALASEMASDFGELELRDGEIRRTVSGTYDLYLELLGDMCPSEPALQEIRNDLDNADRADLRGIRDSAAAVRQILRRDRRERQQPLLFGIKNDTPPSITELARKASEELEAFSEHTKNLGEAVRSFEQTRDSRCMDDLVRVAEKACLCSRSCLLLICMIPEDDKLVGEFVAQQQVATELVCRLRDLTQEERGAVTKETLDMYIAGMRRRLDSMRRRLSEL